MLIKAGFFSLVFSSLFFVFALRVSAQILINEFSSASNPEWVELYNPGPTAISLASFVIYFDDNPSTNQKYEFCDGEEILANGYKLITRPIGSYWLANSGDSIILKNKEAVSDSVSYGAGKIVPAPTASQSATRSPDGSDVWLISDNPSPQGSIVSFECPSPTPESTPLPSATPTSKPSSTPFPSPTSTSKPTVKALVTNKPETIKISTQEGKEEGVVLGLREKLDTPLPTPQVESKRRFPLFAAVFVLGGLGAIGYAAFMFYKSQKLSGDQNLVKKRYNVKSEEE